MNASVTPLHVRRIDGRGGRQRDGGERHGEGDEQQLAFSEAFGVIPSTQAAAATYAETYPENAAFVAGAEPPTGRQRADADRKADQARRLAAYLVPHAAGAAPADAAAEPAESMGALMLGPYVMATPQWQMAHSGSSRAASPKARADSAWLKA